MGAGGSGAGDAKNEKKEKKDRVFSYSNGESPTLLAAAECEVKRLREKLERKRIQVLRLISGSIKALLRRLQRRKRVQVLRLS